MREPRERDDLDAEAAEHYGRDVPVLAEGDEITGLPEYPRDTFTVVGFRAGGMLVDAARHATGQVFCLPRFYVPQHGDGFFLTRSADGE